MGLADRLVIGTTACRAQQVFDALDPDDREAVDQYIATIRQARLTNPFTAVASASKLRAALAAEGHLMSVDTLRDHLGGRCACGKTS